MLDVDPEVDPVFELPKENPPDPDADPVFEPKVDPEVEPEVGPEFVPPKLNPLVAFDEKPPMGLVESDEVAPPNVLPNENPVDCPVLEFVAEVDGLLPKVNCEAPAEVSDVFEPEKGLDEVEFELKLKPPGASGED